MFHFRDVDPQADDAALACGPLLDQNASAVREPLFVALARRVEPLEALGEPLLLATLCLGIVAARDTNPKRILEAAPNLEQIGTALVDLSVLLVPQHVATLGIEEDNALRKDIDCLAQARVGGA